MAQGTSSYVSFAGSNGYNIRIYFEYTHNESNNTITVSLTKLGIQSNNYAGYSTYVDGIIKVNGVETCKLLNNKGVTNLKHSEWYYMTISGSATVKCSNDGSASISISVHANQFTDFNLRSSGGGSYNDRIVNGQARSVTVAASVYVLSLAPTNCSISVSRTYSPSGSLGELHDGAKLWKGDKLKITITPNPNCAVYYSTVNSNPFVSGNTLTVEGNVFVDAIARLMVPSISATDASIGSTSMITIAAVNASHRYTVTYAFGSLSDRIATNTTLTTFGWTVPEIFYSQISGATSGKCIITCEAYSGTTLLGSSSCEILITIAADSSKPLLSGTVVDIDAATRALTGNSNNLIRYKSDAQCSVFAQATNGASLSSVTINGQAVSATGSYLYTDVSVSDFLFSATDSRGYTTTTTIRPNIVPYIRLTINPIIARPNPTGGELTLSFNGNYFNGSFGAHRNTLTIRYRYRNVSTPAYGSWSVVPANAYSVGTSSYETTRPFSLGSQYDYRNAYVFEVQAYDGANGVTLDIASVECPVKKGVPQFDWGENDFSFNIPVNMNGNAISGLPEPTAGGSPVTKSYLDSSLVAVNNSITTGLSGVYESACSYTNQAISGLRDKECLCERLAWENASPSSSFGASKITIPSSGDPKFSDDSIVSWKIEYYFISTNRATTIVQETRYDAAGHRVFAVNYTSSGVGVTFRQCNQDGRSFTFEAAKLNGAETNAMNPVRIWAVHSRKAM